GNLNLEPIVTKRDTSNYWGEIIFSEINYLNQDLPREKDWIELKNISNESVDLSGWKLKIDQDKAVSIINMKLNPGEYIVLSGHKDSLLFARPELDGRRIVDIKRLKLNGRRFRLLLIDEDKRIADSLSVTHTDKHSKAIYLKTPTENNHTLDSWLSAIETTPNEPNQYEKKIEEEKARTERQVYFTGLALLVLGIILLILHRLRKKRKAAL
ncbi:MAG: lamin tail domain-containing protein, partial [Crocinitomicaceae bacterium]|nr:lamin tail domain-containing protein [Crocinitomicaceae bacterium]